MDFTRIGEKSTKIGPHLHKLRENPLFSGFFLANCLDICFKNMYNIGIL